MKRFETLNFGIGFVTPGFLGGAPQGTKMISILKSDGIRRSEVPYYPVDPGGVRIPTLRGILAFWYRSMLGDLASQEVFKQQAEIFGSADTGQGLILRPLGVPHPPKGQPFEDNATALVYLGYGPLQIVKTPEHPKNHASSYNESQCRDAIFPDGEARPAFRFQARGTPEQVDALRRSLRLLHLFGGLGSRSRRGWGSVEVHTDFFTPLPAKGQELSAWFKETLGGALRMEMTSLPAAKGLRFSAFSQNAHAYRTETFTSYKDVLLEFYECFQQTRFWNTPIGKADLGWEKADAKEPKNSIKNPPKRLAFGLPYQASNHWKSSEKWSIEYHGRKSSASKPEVSRRASPLILKVLRVKPDRYVGIALFLRSEFFGESSVEVGAKGKPLTAAFPGYDAVEAFLKHPTWTNLPLF